MVRSRSLNRSKEAYHDQCCFSHRGCETLADPRSRAAGTPAGASPGAGGASQPRGPALCGSRPGGLGRRAGARGRRNCLGNLRATVLPGGTTSFGGLSSGLRATTRRTRHRSPMADCNARKGGRPAEAGLRSAAGLGASRTADDRLGAPASVEACPESRRQNRRQEAVQAAVGRAGFESGSRPAGCAYHGRDPSKFAWDALAGGATTECRQ